MEATELLTLIRKDLDLISGSRGTTKLNGTSVINGKFRAICFSEDGEIAALADNNTPPNDRSAYFTGGFTFKAGDILVAKNQEQGRLITSIQFVSGSGVGIDE